MIRETSSHKTNIQAHYFQFNPYLISFKDSLKYQSERYSIRFTIYKFSEFTQKKTHKLHPSTSNSQPLKLDLTQNRQSMPLETAELNFYLFRVNSKNKQKVMVKLFLLNNQTETELGKFFIEIQNMISNFEEFKINFEKRTEKLGDLIIDFDVYIEKSWDLVEKLSKQKKQERKKQIYEKTISKANVPQKVQKQFFPEKEQQNMKERQPVEDRKKEGYDLQQSNSLVRKNKEDQKKLNTPLMEIELSVLEKLRVEDATPQFENNVKQYIKKLQRIVKSLLNKMNQQNLLYQEQIEDLKGKINQINAERQREFIRLKKLMLAKQDQIKMYKEEIGEYKKREFDILSKLVEQQLQNNRIQKRDIQINLDNQQFQKLEMKKYCSNEIQKADKVVPEKIEEQEFLKRHKSSEQAIRKEDPRQSQKQQNQVELGKRFLLSRQIGSTSSRITQRK